MPPKRKRNDRASGDGNRPAPHHPGEAAMAQQDRRHLDNGPRRGGRGGGRATRSSDRRESAGSQYGPSTPTTAQATPGPRSPMIQRPSSSSSQQPAVSAMAAVVAPPANLAPESPVALNYNTSIITEARINGWAKGGRQEVLEHGTQLSKDETAVPLSVLFQELVYSVLASRIDPSSAGQLAKDIIAAGPKDEEISPFTFNPTVLLLDTVSMIMDVETGAFQYRMRDFMMATGVSPMLMRQVLDAPLLQNLGLIRHTFIKLGIRQSTNLLYRQANYNLLREETEGYSKLITELFTTSSNEAPTAETVLATFEKVKGLIGTFDLDVGRVLDVTLDVFAAVLIKQFRFFIKLLRISSWWPRSQTTLSMSTYAGGLPNWALPESSHWMTSEEDEVALAQDRLKRDVHFWTRARQVETDAYYELGGREILDSNTRYLANDDAKGHLEADLELDWMRSTKTLPPAGNRTAAQLLGFKLRFYNSEAKDDNDVLPANVLYLAALLIKTGFISLCDLYPHLSPAEEEMDAVREQKAKFVEEDDRRKRPGATMNALVMAGALRDDDDDKIPKAAASARVAGADTKPPSDTEAVDNQKIIDQSVQKVQLLICLLTIGAIPESLFLLGRFPWMAELYTEITPLIHRILHHSINKVYIQSQPTCMSSAACPSKKLPDIDQTGVAKGAVKLSANPPKRFLRWPYPDSEQDGQSYRFYWDEWADNVPVCQTVDDFFSLCRTFVNVTGVNIGKDASLLTKFATVGAKSLGEDQSPQNRDRWQDLLRRLLVPALSLTTSNASVVDAVWQLLKQYPATTRYIIYADWFEGQISRLPPIQAAFARARSETLSTMKRLSLENITAMARTLAKTAFACPGIVFKVALSQIESYTNLIEAFVECAKYFTELGYDVLVWSLMNALGNKTRSRTQAQSVLHTSQWLQALSRFSGKVFKRYSIMQPTPVIQYVNEQLYKGNSTDLVILKEFIFSMGGVVPGVDFTDAQLRAMTGGDVLRRETLKSLGDKRHDSTRSGGRLMRSLVDSKLAGRILLNIAQYRQAAVYNVPEDEAHIKYLSTILDEVHQVLTQYLDLLRHSFTPEEFDALVPTIMESITDFGLDANLSFMIGRDSLTFYMSNPKSIDQPQQQASPSQGPVDGDGDVPMEQKESASPLSTAQTMGEVDVVDDKMAVDDKGTPLDPATSSAASVSRKQDHYLDALQPIINTIQRTKPDEIWQVISPEFFTMFWTLQLGDLSVPESSYMAEHSRLQKQAEAVMKDRSDMTRSGMNKKEEKKQKFEKIAKEIRDEMNRHVERYQKTRFRLTKQSKTWFSVAASSVDAVSDAVLEHCILPRVPTSALDAEYCYRMIKFLHENRAPNFQLMSVYNRFFKDNRLRSMMFSCTVRETESLGRFIKCILADLSRWHADRAIYEKEALGQKELSGIRTRTLLGFATTLDDDGKPQSFVEHAPYRDLLFVWHKELNKALKSCLAGMEWMHIRNAITVLKAVLDYFPAVEFMGNQFLKQLETITKREAASKSSSESDEGHRVDLSVTAQTAYSELQRRKKKWVQQVNAFRPNISGESQEDSQKAPDTPAQVATILKPTAREFKPQRNTNSAGRSQTTVEVEDGEVKDGKDAKPAASQHTSNAPTQTAAQAKEKEKEKETAGAPADITLSRRPATPTAPLSRSATTMPTQTVPNSVASSRSEVPRPSGSGSSGSRLAHSLPNRPDVPLPSRFSHDRHGQIQYERRDATRDSRDPRAGPRDAREPRETREGRDPREARDVREQRDSRESRDYRTPEGPRPERPAREFAGPDRSDRRQPEGPARDASRSFERDRTGRPEPPPRWVETGPTHDRDSRAPRERAAGRNHDGRPAREPLGPPPVPPPPSTQPLAVEPPINPERARLLAVSNDRPEIMNPARAAIISSNRDDSVPKPDDPRRAEHHSNDSGTPEVRRDDRHGRSYHSDRSSRGGREAPEFPPPGPSRGDRHADREAARREPLPPAGAPTLGRLREADEGRLSHQDPNYGRLNPIQSVVDVPAATIPSEPRGRGRNTARVSSMNPPPRTDTRFPPSGDSHRALSPDRTPPTGPSSSRSRRGPPGHYDSGPSFNSLNTAPRSPSAGLGHGVGHGDRMSHAPAPPAGDMHPDRLTQLGSGAPPPPPRGPSAGQHRAPGGSVQTPDRPPAAAGLRQTPSLTNSPNVDHPSSYSTPTGPSSANDRLRTGGRRQLAGINSTLQQAGMSDAGRPIRPPRGGPRGSIAGSDAQVLTGSSPVTTPIHERQDPPVRRDMGGDRGAGEGVGSRSGMNGDDYTSRDHDRSSRRDRDSHRHGSGRPSRRGSRERSPEREPKDQRDYRDRRPGPPGAGGRGETERESGPPRRGPLREDWAGSSGRPSGRGGGNMRENGRPVDERGGRDSRREDNRGRKRPSGEDLGPIDREKRVKR